VGVIYFKSNLSELRNDPFARFDVDYLDIYKSFNAFPKKLFLNDFITFIETGKSISKKDYNDGISDYAHIVVRNITTGTLVLENLIYINEEKGEFLKPFKLIKGDILIAISSNVGASCLVDKDYDIQLTLSHYITRIRIDENKLNKKLLVYYLNSKLIKKYFRSTETGKTLKNLSKVYIHRLPVALPDSIEKQNDIAAKITPIEQKIKGLKADKKDALEIINKVFAKEFGFNWDEFEKLKAKKFFTASLKECSNNVDCRSSFKFHNEAGKYIYDFICSKTDKRVKDFMALPTF